MTINKGTLVGAPIKQNDSADQYPVADQNDIAGGRHTRDTTADMEAMGAYLRKAGMECYVTANGNTYVLENDLTTWTFKSNGSGGSTDPGSGGDAETIQIISGNFGIWTALSARTTHFFDEQIELKFKADLQAFPSRAIVYVTGQFGLADDFESTTITLGNIPVNCRPAAQIKQYMICKNIELFFIIETNGDVKLTSKDGLNLPTGSGVSEDQPYFIQCFYQPEIGEYEPTTYTASRTADFTRNNCESGSTGTTVSFSKSYTSTVDQPTAEAIADANFNADGQAYANDPDNGATCEVPSDPIILTLSFEIDGDHTLAHVTLSDSVDDSNIDVDYNAKAINTNSQWELSSGILNIPAGETTWTFDLGIFNDSQGLPDTIGVEVYSISPEFTSTGRHITSPQSI